uniref:Uncharacterized protein n=1 Tax=Salmo trutta TaxID=8032 RepID=A0A674BJ80_SALTR
TCCHCGLLQNVRLSVRRLSGEESFCQPLMTLVIRKVPDENNSKVLRFYFDRVHVFRGMAVMFCLSQSDISEYWLTSQVNLSVNEHTLQSLSDNFLNYMLY